MKQLKILLLALAYNFHIIQADPDLPGVVATSKGDPDTIVAGCISAINGHYVYSKQPLVVEGAVPLILSQFYVSGNGEGHNNGWEFFPHFILSFEGADPKKCSVNVAEPSGGDVHYKSERTWDGGKILMDAVVDEYTLGVSNTAGQQLSGRTNIKNSHAFFRCRTKESHKETVIEHIEEAYVQKGDGLRRYYEKVWRSHKQGSHTRNFLLVLTREELPNGGWILYQSDEEARPTFIQVVNRNQTKVFAWARFRYDGPEKDNRNFHIETSDGKQLHYTFEKRQVSKGVWRSYFTEVKGSIPYEEKYIFGDPPKKCNSLLHELRQDDKIQQKIFYRQSAKKDHGYYHPHDNRVTELWQSTGQDLVRTHTFDYHLARWRYPYFQGNSWTVAHGLHGFKEEIEWSWMLRPIKFLYHDTQNPSHSLQWVHYLIWGNPKSREVGDLKARAILDHNNRTINIRSYLYDEKSNPIRETFTGNLSGTWTEEFHVTAEGKPHGGENYSHHYQYSNDGRNLLVAESDDNGKVIRYHYLPETNLLSIRLTGDHQQIVAREFFIYNGDHLLVEEITDDGTSDQVYDLSNVTQRQIKRTIRRSDGMPERIEELFYNPITRKEQLIKSIQLHYSPTLKVVRQDLHDGNGQHIHSLFFEYDQIGRIIAKSDPLGRWTKFAYDHLGRCSHIEDPELCTHTTYGGYGQIVQIDKTASGETQTGRFIYNEMGQKIASIDIFGSITHFYPDPWGRPKKIEYPNGSCEENTYDAIGCPIKTISRSDGVTTRRFNAYGNPTEVTHPDGSQETYLYNFDGTLRESVNAQGTRTLHLYDHLGRLITKQVIDKRGTLLTEEHYHYRGFQLIEQIDAEGISTQFTYDGAGRKTAEHRGEQTTTYTYDTLGRLASTLHHDWQQEFSYDLFDRIICEKTLSSAGELQKEIHYAYDARGNRTEIITMTSQGPSVEQSLYDSFDRLVAKIDPLGAKTHFAYAHQKGLLCKTTTDPLGTEQIEHIGSMGERLFSEIRSSTGETLSSETHTYNAAGFCIHTRSTLPRGTIDQAREYDLSGHLITRIEAQGTIDQRITRHVYGPGGLLLETTKHDGTQLFYEYDSLSRLHQCLASTGDGYRYTYNRLHQIVHVEDLKTGLCATRSYHPSGQIEQEQFPHGLTISYKRDYQGRPIGCYLPDGSGVIYTWKGIHLFEVTRTTTEGYPTYRSTYDVYDLSGKRTRTTMIGAMGVEERSYDLAGRLNTCQSSSHAEVAQARNLAGNLLKLRTLFAFSQDEISYSYDPLQQLTSEFSRYFLHHFTFDAHSTLLKKDDRETSTNALYQILSHGETVYVYDQVGRLIQDPRYRYEYDGFDRLFALEEPGKTRTQYTYDSWHRRTQKTLFSWENNEWVPKTARFFLYDGFLEIGATDEEGTLVEFRTLGITPQAETGAAIAIELDGKVYAPLHDLQGHVIALADLNTATLQEIYRYSAFGETRIYNSKHEEISTSKLDNPWRYYSKRYDPESGLSYFGRRYFHVGLGSWITPDPAGTLDRPNLYAFLRGNPLSFYDPQGLASRPFNEATGRRYDQVQHTALSRGLDSVFGAAAACAGYLFYYGGYHLPVPYVRDGVVNAGAWMAQDPSKYVDQAEWGYGVGEINPNDRSIRNHVNGICTSFSEFKQRLQYASEQCGGARFEGVYSPTHGLPLDLLECFLEKVFGFETHAAHLIKKKMRKDHATLSERFPDGNFSTMWVAHSEGNLQMDIALKGMKGEREILQKAEIYGLASPVIIDKGAAGIVDIAISRWDLVGWIDIAGRLQHHDHVTILEPVGGLPGLDHGFMGDTYRKEFQNICDDNMKRWSH